MKWVYLAVAAVLLAAAVPLGDLSLGHAALHVLAPAMAAVPLYLSTKAYLRTRSQRFLNLATAFGLLFTGQTALSYSMYTNTVIYVGDIPLEHLLHYAAFVFFTAALLEKRQGERT